MRYASVCSGVEAASLAWMPLGWEAAWFSEIEPFPCAVLAERFPNVPNLGDMTTISITENGDIHYGATSVIPNDGRAIDLIVGGTPCQDASVAGKRAGLVEGERSKLAFTFTRLVPVWLMNWRHTVDFGGLCGKTCRASSPSTKDGTSRLFFRVLPDGSLSRQKTDGEPSALSRKEAEETSDYAGECWTCNIAEWTAFPVRFRKDEGVSSLSDILVTGDVPPRYYLSQVACAGIIRRSEARGKKLPPMLEDALRRQMDSENQAMGPLRTEMKAEP